MNKKTALLPGVFGLAEETDEEREGDPDLRYTWSIRVSFNDIATISI